MERNYKRREVTYGGESYIEKVTLKEELRMDRTYTCRRDTHETNFWIEKRYIRR